MRHLYLFAFLLAAPLAAQTDFSSQLPILVIDTQGGEIVDEPKIMARMGVVDNGPGALNRPDDEFNEYDGWVGIEFRGSTSQSFPKKGFGLETREQNGEDRNVELLGFPEEEDWVLHGPFSDKSLIRNALLYDLAGLTMDWAPRVRMVELIVNDDYRGVYLFTERIKRDGDRVDVARLREDETTGDDLTGGYILKFDKFTGEDVTTNFAFVSNYRAETEFEQTIPIVYDYPSPEDLVPEQRNYIRDWVHAFEDRLMGPDWLDPVAGYAPLIDQETVADFFIYNEISRNVDGYRLSTYFSKEKDSDGGRLRFGPVWDYNLAYGNANYCRGSETEGWGYEFSDYCPQDGFQISPWWGRFAADPAVRRLIRERYTDLREGPLADEALTARIDSFVDLMGADAVARNFARWPILGVPIWPNEFVGRTHAAEIDYLTGWALDRLAWLDGQWLIVNSAENPIAANPRMTLFPNPSPAGTVLNVQLSGVEPAGHQLYVSDALGRELARGPASAPLRLGGGLPHGLYVVTLRTAAGRSVTAERWVVR